MGFFGDREKKEGPGVLFVDDEPNVLEGFKRMVRVLRPDWVPHYANNGGEALFLLAQKPIDIVVADLAMREMDGATLLEKIQTLHPQIIRMILSSEADQESERIYRSTRFAHQFLVKPCKSEVLQEKITKALGLRKLMKNTELLKVINGIPFLPSLPPLYHELLKALDSPNVSMEDIGSIISRDVSMTGRVLHLVNSAFFGFARKITNPTEAVVLLGINVLKTLVLFVRLFFSAPDTIVPGLSLDDLWAHSSLTGTLAKRIIISEGGTLKTQEEAMLAGMMHDIGKLLVIDAKGYIPKVLKAVGSGKSFVEAEYESFGTSHAEIGAYLMGIWGMPDNIIEAIACHHRPGNLIPTEFSVLTAVHVANAVLQSDYETPPLREPVASVSGTPPAFDLNYLKRIGMEGRVPAWEALVRENREKLQKK